MTSRSNRMLGVCVALLVAGPLAFVRPSPAESLEYAWQDTTVVRTAGPVHIGTGRLEEKLAIGGEVAERNYLFSFIASVAVDARGRMLVADNAPAAPMEGRATGVSVRLFDAAGRYVRTIGRFGDGPGEFRSARAAMFTKGGDVVIVDRLKRDVLMFDSTGRWLRTWRVPRLVGDDVGSVRFVPYAQVDTSGLIWIPSDIGPGRSGGGFYRYVRFRSDSSVVDTIAVPDGRGGVLTSGPRSEPTDLTPFVGARRVRTSNRATT